jgi:UDP-N-acetylmuramyl pentapeptide phosphotransferase/UDP-N-acetylglucosamine-1-phosphate transferase
MLASILAATFLVSTWLTRMLASTNSTWSTLDYPAAHSIHRTPTPRTGGIAIIASLVLGIVSIAILARFGLTDEVIRQGIATFGDGTGHVILWLTFGLATVSAIDDRYRLPPLARLVVHIMVALGMIWSGLKLDHFSVPFVGTFSLGWWGGPLTVLFVVWMVNLYNFMDGLDGLAAGMAVSGFGVLAAVAWAAGAVDLALFGLVIVAATGGFLVSNFPPARIFMGDVGSTSLGFLAAAYTLRASHDRVFEAWIPILAFSPFIVDATVTVVTRGLTGQRVFEPHRQHYYQRLVLAGWSHRKTLFAEYALMAGGGVAASSYGSSSLPAKVAILSIVAVSYLVLAVSVRFVQRRAAGRTVREQRVPG